MAAGIFHMMMKFDRMIPFDTWVHTSAFWPSWPEVTKEKNDKGAWQQEPWSAQNTSYT